MGCCGAQAVDPGTGGEPIERLDGAGGVGTRYLDRPGDPTATGDDLDSAGAIVGGHVVGQERAQLVAGVAGERPEDGERVHPFLHVVAGGLAELGLGGNEVEHVVDDLKVMP